MTYSWLSVHRVRFAAARDAGTDGAPSGPPGAAAWRFGPHAPLGEDGLRTGISDIWGGTGFYASRADAETVVADPEAALPFLRDAAEHWHALACVIAHRGEVDWSTPTEPHPALAPVDRDPGGVLAVITTAGYVSRDASQRPRIIDFLARVDQVVDHYRTLDANTAAMLFNAVEAKDGMTFSIWKSDPQMIASAYRSGVHPENLARHRETPMFDRSSFTRLRLLASSGTWDGVDPRAAAA